MLRILAVLTLLILLAAGGCVFQANNASQGIEVNPFKWGSGEQVVGPANDSDYANGEPVDMRSRR